MQLTILRLVLNAVFCCLQNGGSKRYYLNNHLKFTILHHKDAQSEKSRIVGFEVKPYSVKHTYNGNLDENDIELNTCHARKMITVSEQMDPQPVEPGKEVIFTYSVTFKVQQHTVCHLNFMLWAICSLSSASTA